MRILLLSTTLISFFAFGIVSLPNMMKVYDKIILKCKNIGESVAEFTENLAVKQAKKRLSELAFEKSRLIERGMSSIKYNAESIAFQMQQILSKPENYKPVTIPNHNDRPIYSGEAYIHYAPEVLKKGLTEELKQEVAINSNIADTLNIIASSYKGHQTSSYIGSKNGYLICIDTLPNEKDTVFFTKEFNETYDPRERPWYKAAEKANKAIITDYYLSADGYLSVDCASPYYDAEGKFAGVAAVGSSLESLYQQITEDKYGDTNISFTLNNNGEIVLSSINTGTLAVSKEHKDLRKLQESSLAKEIIKMTEGKSDVALVEVDGTKYYLAYSPMSSIGWSYGTLIERDEVIKPANSVKDKILSQTILFTSALKSFFLQHIKHIILSLIIIIALLFVVSIIFSKSFVRPILVLTSGVKEIAKGNLDKKLDIKTGDEIEVLSDSVNNMTSELKLYMENFSRIAAEKERIATELNVAKNIQAGMLPSVEPDFSNKKEFDLAAVMNPAKEVGGDFYDFYMLDDNHLALTVADVSGKGVGAALFMVISKTILKNLTTMASSAYSAGNKPDLALIMEQTNQQLYANNEEHMFVTVFFGILDLITGEFAYINAGHNPPLVRRQNEEKFSFVRNEKKNRVIGVSKTSKYQEHHLTLSSGDMLFLYTDGITEAMNEQRELFNDKRLNLALNTIKKESNAHEMLETVYESVKQHVGNAEQSDDMTMLGLVYKM